MVLEMMQGGELFDRIRKKISFTESEASDITRQVRTIGEFHFNIRTVRFFNSTGTKSVLRIEKF